MCVFLALLGGVNGAPEADKKKEGEQHSRARTHRKDSANVDETKPEQTNKPKPEQTSNLPPGDVSGTERKREYGPDVTIDPNQLVEFADQPVRVKDLIQAGLELAGRNLTYTYGSADPANGGMDCSGTLYYLLRSQGFEDVPRDSPGLYAWVRKAGGFRAVVSTNAESFEFNELRPGDLLYWSGTYSIQRDIPVTHVMLYLGREKKSKQRVMFGASDGRSYQGIPRWGVSVFDFKMPGANTSARFLGYGRIPGLRGGEEEDVSEKSARQANDEPGDEPSASEKVAVKKKHKRAAPKAVD